MNDVVVAVAYHNLLYFLFLVNYLAQMMNVKDTLEIGALKLNEHYEISHSVK